MHKPARLRVWISAIGALIAVTSTSLADSPHAGAAGAADCATTVFTGGEAGFHTYRIPALIRAGSTVLALAEGRRNGSGDVGDIEIVGKRSTNAGCSWGPLQRISDNGTDVVGNPAVTLDPATGRLVLLTVRQAGDLTEATITAGRAKAAEGRRVYVQYSTDQGAKWTAAKEITGSVKKPAWTWWSTGGHGVALVKNTDHPGRLVVPMNYASPTVSGAGIVYSDDHGTSWHIGATDDHTDGVLKPNEASLAELNDGRIYLNARDNGGTDPATRLFTYSLHGGGFYSSPYRPEPDLVAPEIRGSLLQDPGLPAGVSCAPLLFSAPADPTTRQNLVIRRSGNGGWVWKPAVTVTSGPAGYSDLTKVDRTHVGILYETGDATYRDRIDFRSVALSCPNP